MGYAALLGTILALVILFGSLRAPTHASSHPLRAPTHASSQTFRRLESRLSIFGVYILCMVVFALPFGAGLAFNAFIVSAFHAQNRISILLVLLGVLSLCLVAQYIRDASKARILGAALIILPVAVDFYQNRNVALHSYQTCPSHDENSKRQCERWLSAQLKTAFTAMRLSNIRHVALFPIHPFPEAGPLGSRSDYFGFIPYILEPADLDVAYSYGMSRRSKTFKSLKAAESALLASDGTDNSIARAVADVACIGYDAILVDRQAYSAKDRSLLDDRLLRDTHAALLSESNDYRLYRLAKPSAVDCIKKGK